MSGVSKSVDGGQKSFSKHVFKILGILGLEDLFSQKWNWIWKFTGTMNMTLFSWYTPFLEGSKTLPFQIPRYFILKCKSRDCSWNRWFSSVTGSQTTTQKWWQKNDRSVPKLIYKDVFCDWRERRTRPDLTVTSIDCTNNLHPTFIQPSQFTQEQLFNSFPRSELELDQQWSVVLFIRWGLSRVIKND